MVSRWPRLSVQAVPPCGLRISVEPGGDGQEAKYQFAPVRDLSPSTLRLTSICKVFGPRLWIKFPYLSPYSSLAGCNPPQCQGPDPAHSSPAKETLTLGQVFGFEDFQAEVSPSQGDPSGAQEIALNVFLVFRDLLLLQLRDNRTRGKHDHASQKS